jgi:hypothetical protein
LREYYRIKQDPKNEEMLVLLHFITSAYPVAKEEARVKVLRLLGETDNPVEFIRRIEAEF